MLLLRASKRPKGATLDGVPIKDQSYDPARRLLWLRFPNQPKPQTVEVKY